MRIDVEAAWVRVQRRCDELDAAAAESGDVASFENLLLGGLAMCVDEETWQRQLTSAKHQAGLTARAGAGS